MLKQFKELSEREILALAIQNEEEDGRIFGEFADQLRESYPATARMFEDMREEEAAHRDRLFATFRERFGDHIPLIRREDVKGFLKPRPLCLEGPPWWAGTPKSRTLKGKEAELVHTEDPTGSWPIAPQGAMKTL